MFLDSTTKYQLAHLSPVQKGKGLAKQLGAARFGRVATRTASGAQAGTAGRRPPWRARSAPHISFRTPKGGAALKFGFRLASQPTNQPPPQRVGPEVDLNWTAANKENTLKCPSKNTTNTSLVYTDPNPHPKQQPKSPFPPLFHQLFSKVFAAVR